MVTKQRSGVSTAGASLNKQDAPSRSRFNLRPDQKDAVAFLRKRHGIAALFAEMSVGKSRIVLAYLKRTNARRVLVVSTPEVINDRVWPKEIKKVGLPWRTLTLDNGLIEKRAAVLARMPERDEPVFALVNLEAYWRYPAEEKVDIKTGVTTKLKLRGLRKAILDWKPDTIIIDEIDKLASCNTSQSKFAHYLGALPFVERRLGLTGTPVTEGLEDLFSQYKFIDPDVFGNAWGDFQRRYIVMGGYGGYQILGYRGEEEVKAKLERTAYQIATDDALTLPGRTTRVVPVTLSRKTREVYERMRKEALVEIEAPDEHGRMRRGSALARIVLTTLLRLQQIANGYLPIREEDGDARTVTFLGDEKVRKAAAIVKWHTELAKTRRRVVIFCLFRPDIDRLAKTIPNSRVIHGDISMPQRRANREAFRRGDTTTLIVQTRTSSRGIDLTAGSVAIYYSLGYSLKDFAQARARVRRKGQETHVLEYVIEATKTVDEKIFKALTEKQNIARRIVRLDYVKGLLK